MEDFDSCRLIEKGPVGKSGLPSPSGRNPDTILRVGKIPSVKGLTPSGGNPSSGIFPSKRNPISGTFRHSPSSGEISLAKEPTPGEGNPSSGVLSSRGNPISGKSKLERLYCNG